MKNIIVPIDFSNVTDKVVANAADIATSFSAKLWLIHVAAPDPEFVGYEVGPQHVRDWRAETILKNAEKLNAELIILGTHGHGVIHKVLVGSVSASIIKKATCPVMLIPAREDT